MAADNDNAIDPGLATLVILLRVHGVDTDADQIATGMGLKLSASGEMLRCAKELGLKARAPKDEVGALANTHCPGSQYYEMAALSFLARWQATRSLCTARHHHVRRK